MDDSYFRQRKSVFPSLNRKTPSTDIEMLPNKKGYVFKTITGSDENVILRKIARQLISTYIKLELHLT